MRARVIAKAVNPDMDLGDFDVLGGDVEGILAYLKGLLPVLGQINPERVVITIERPRP